jgi:hypothetical protein
MSDFDGEKSFIWGSIVFLRCKHKQRPQRPHLLMIGLNCWRTDN